MHVQSENFREPHKFVCVGQTGRPFHKIFREHFNDFKYGNGNSKFAQHLLDNRHSIGTREEIMDVLHVVKKRKTNGHSRKIPYL